MVPGVWLWTTRVERSLFHACTHGKTTDGVAPNAHALSRPRLPFLGKGWRGDNCKASSSSLLLHACIFGNSLLLCWYTFA